MLVLVSAFMALHATAQVRFLSKYEMTTGKYWFHQKGQPYGRVNVEVTGDSIALYSMNDVRIFLTMTGPVLCPGQH